MFMVDVTNERSIGLLDHESDLRLGGGVQSKRRTMVTIYIGRRKYLGNSRSRSSLNCSEPCNDND